MSTQLTISIELITFMKWVLKHKRDAFAQFIQDSITPELAHNLKELAQDTTITVSGDELYQTLSTFMQYLEAHVQRSAQQTSSLTEHNRGTCRNPRHAHGRRRGSDVSTELQSIESPIQRVLYEALLNGEKTDVGVH